MVLSPTNSTCILALPLYTTDPRYTLLLIFFLASFDSPFKADSSTDKLPLISTPSAGILSPLFKITISPTTTSPVVISTTLPFLITFTLPFNASLCKRLKACSEPYSEIVEINDAKNMAISIPIVSNQSKCLNKTMTLIAKAISKILMIGSAKDSSNKCQKVFFLTSVISFVPYSVLLLITSLSLSPICLSSQNKYMNLNLKKCRFLFYISPL